MKDKNFNSNEMYERAREKSVGEQKKVAYIRVKKSGLKAMFITIAIASIIATSGTIVGINKLADTYHTSTIVAEQMEEGRHLVNSNTKRTNDNQHFYYETDVIAEELVKDPENFDKNLYGVYKAIGYNKSNQLEQIEDVVSNVGHIVSSSKEDLGINYYKNFTDYCVKKGFVQKDGNIDLEAYEKAVRSQIVNEEEIKNLQEEVDKFKSR